MARGRSGGGKQPASAARERPRRLFMVDLFETLPHEELAVLAELCEPVEYGAGERIFRPGTDADRVYVLEEGRVRIYTKVPQNREITFAVLEGGTVFGRLNPDGRPQGTYAQAMEDSIVSTLDREDLVRLVMRRPEVGLRIASLADERLALAEDQATDLAHKEVPGRLASLVLRLVESEGIVTSSGYALTTPYTHQQFASMVGSNREAVTRAFARLRETGALETHRRRVRVTNMQALERAAMGHWRRGSALRGAN